MEGRGSALLLEGATPLRQHPTGLRGSGHTPGLLARPPSQLFDGLPPSPAALASASAWHASVGQPQQQPQPQLQPQAPPPAGASKQPRSPIGPDVRHTKKSLAAAAAAATERASPRPPSALQRLKTSRQPAPAAAPAPRVDSASSPITQQQEQQQLRQQVEAAAAASPVPEETAPQPPPPPPPQLPPGSNAAMVADVRQLAAKLQASLLKHARGPEPAAAAPSPHARGFSASPTESLPSQQLWLERRADLGTGGSVAGWSLAAARASSPAAAALAPSPPPPPGFPPSSSLLGSAARKFSLADASGSAAQLSDFGSGGVDGGSALSLGSLLLAHPGDDDDGGAVGSSSGGSPGSDLGGGAGASLVRMASGLSCSDSLLLQQPSAVSVDFGLADFDRHTAHLRRQLAALG